MKGGSYLSIGLGSLLALLGGGLYLIYNRGITQPERDLSSLLEIADQQAEDAEERNLQILNILGGNEITKIENKGEREKAELAMLNALEQEMLDDEHAQETLSEGEQEMLRELEEELKKEELKKEELKNEGGQRKKKKRYLKRLTGGSDINIQIIGSLAVLAIGTFFLVRRLTTTGSNNQHDMGSNEEEGKENALIQSAIELINVNEKPQYELVTATLLQVLSKITGSEIKNQREKLKDKGQRQLLKKILEREVELPKKKKLLKLWMFRQVNN